MDVLFHECTFPEVFIEYRAKGNVGIHAHTPPTDLGKIAQQAGVKIGRHSFRSFDSTSPMIKTAGAPHMPVDLMGPHLMDDVVRDIRKNYDGELLLAHDLMRIDL